MIYDLPADRKHREKTCKKTKFAVSDKEYDTYLKSHWKHPDRKDGVRAVLETLKRHTKIDPKNENALMQKINELFDFQRTSTQSKDI